LPSAEEAGVSASKTTTTEPVIESSTKEALRSRRRDSAQVLWRKGFSIVSPTRNMRRMRPLEKPLLGLSPRLGPPPSPTAKHPTSQSPARQPNPLYRRAVSNWELPRCPRTWQSCVVGPFGARIINFMAVRITRKMPFGAGSKGFRFRNYADATADGERYREGCALEEARFRRGSLAEKMYQRLSRRDSIGPDLSRGSRKT
jgi:hypothetical protein